MTASSTLAQPGTALLIMDFQNDIVQMVPEARRGPVLDNAAKLLAHARAKGVPVFYVVVRFREGYPEISARNKGFSAIKAAGRLNETTEGAQIHASVAPRANEAVVVKRRVSGFYNTDLEALLSGHDVNRLVLSGLFTSGVVLSTTRWAADRDYALVIAGDACQDADEEVHRVLIEKVLARQADVVTTASLIGA